MINISKKLIEKQGILILLITALSLLLAAMIYRAFYFEGLLVGETSYYDALMAEQISSGQFSSHNPYHYLLAGLSFFTSIEFASKILPILLGLSSLLIFNKLLKYYKFPVQHRFIILLVLIFSPAFISIFSVSNPHAFSILLSISGIYLLFTKKQGLAVLVFAFSSLFGLFNVLLALFALSLHYLKEKHNTKFFIAALLFVIVSSTFFYLNFGLQIEVQPQRFLQNTFSDLGAFAGLGVFDFILATLGFVLLWKNKKRFALPYALFFFLVFGRIFSEYVNAYLAFVTSFFGGFAFNFISKYHFKVKLIKNLTLLIIICGLIFSSLSFVNRAAHSQPTVEQVDSLLWLKGQPTGNVLSHYNNGFWINYFSEKPALVNAFSSEELINVSEEIFYSRNLEKTRLLLSANNISYIWIDKDMLKGEVWSKKNEGLLFLFRNNETFKNIYTSPNVEIWKVLG